MKKMLTPTESKTFLFKFKKSVVVLCILGILLCLAGIATSIWRLTTEPLEGVTDFLQSPLLIGVCIFGLVVLISMLVKSQYVVDEKDLTVQFGIVKSKTPVSAITALELDKDTEKLSLYCGETFTVIAVNKSWNDEFVQAIQAVNPNVEYSVVLVKHKPKENKK